MTRAVAYIRVSGKSQVDGDGPERQELAIRAFAAANDIQVERVFFDAGVSGTKEGFDRPGWVEMVNYLDNQETPNLVLIERLDRMARDVIAQETAIRYLSKAGWALRSVQEPDLCEVDPSRKLIRVIMGAIAGYERDVLVLKMKAAKARKRARGERTDGAFAFGQHPGYPQEQTTLQVMHELRNSGLKDVEVTRELNRRGLKPRRGEQWQQMSVARILQRQHAAA